MIALVVSCSMVACCSRVAGVDIDHLNGEFLESPSHDISRLAELLEMGADVNARREDGTTRLYWATLHRDTELVEFLVERGADVNIPGLNFGFTPLHLLAATEREDHDEEADLEIAEILLANGADVNARRYGRDTPFERAVMNGKEVLAALLKKHGGESGFYPDSSAARKAVVDLSEARGDSGLSFDDPPVSIHQVPPRYPDLARDLGIEGGVYVMVTIDKAGRVTSSEVVKSAGLVLNEAALEAAGKWLFTPAKKDDRPIVCRYMIPFEFKLRDEASKQHKIRP